MKILDRYLLSKFIFIFSAAMLVFLAIFHVVNIIENMDRFISHHMTIVEIGKYYWYQLPFFIDIATPMSMLLAAVFTLGGMSRDNELTAIKALGISLYRVCLPLLIFAMFMSVASFFFNDFVVIPYNRKKTQVEKKLMNRHKDFSKKIFRNIMLQDNPQRNLVIGKYYLDRKLGRNVSIQIMQNNTLKERIDAETIKYNSEHKTWEIHHFTVRKFKDSAEVSVKSSEGDSLINLNLRPADFAKKNIKPKNMRIGELDSFISRLEHTGNDATRWKVKFNYKIAFPLTSFIVVLFGLPLTAMFRRNSIGYGAGISLLVIFIYYGFIKFGEILGYKGILSPFWAAWVGNVVFLIGGGILFFNIRQ